MNTKHVIGIVVVISTLLLGGALLFTPAPTQVAEAPTLADGEAILSEPATSSATAGIEEDTAPVESERPVQSAPEWRQWFPVTVPYIIGTTSVEASVARTLAERVQGLSGTPYLPEGVVKLFVFEEAGSHGIWMRGMQYPLDILWLDAEGTVVHIETNVAPETFPQSFASPVPAWYVVEAAAGFVGTYGVEVGTETTLP